MLPPNSDLLQDADVKVDQCEPHIPLALSPTEKEAMFLANFYFIKYRIKSEEPKTAKNKVQEVVLERM